MRILAIGLIALLAAPAVGAPLTYTFSSTASGSLDGVPFTDADIEIVAFVDSDEPIDNAALFPSAGNGGQLWVALSPSVEIFVYGFNPVQLLRLSRLFSSLDAGGTGLGMVGIGSGADIVQLGPMPELGDYRLDAELAGLTGPIAFPYFASDEAPTSGGQLIITSANGVGMFSASGVPLPPLVKIQFTGVFADQCHSGLGECDSSGLSSLTGSAFSGELTLPLEAVPSSKGEYSAVYQLDARSSGFDLVTANGMFDAADVESVTVYTSDCVRPDSAIARCGSNDHYNIRIESGGHVYWLTVIGPHVVPDWLDGFDLLKPEQLHYQGQSTYSVLEICTGDSGPCIGNVIPAGDVPRLSFAGEYLPLPVAAVVDQNPDINVVTGGDQIEITIFGASYRSGDSVEFDAGQIEPLSLAVGEAGFSDIESFSTRHVDIDGNVDAVVLLSARATGVSCGESIVSIVGETIGAVSFATAIPLSLEACAVVGGGSSGGSSMGLLLIPAPLLLILAAKRRRAAGRVHSCRGRAP